ncbi:hypothetical protein ABPG74_014512 [Tetrahymena malaccensis]
MEVCSPRQQLIIDLQHTHSDHKEGWKNLIKKTSQDGFVHGNPRPHSPIKISAYTKGSWEDFIKRSDMVFEGKGIKVPPHKKDHFELGYGTIALVDEKDMFNLRGQKRIKVENKHSQIFDAYRKQYSTNIMSDKEKLLWIERYRSDYTKYHHTEYPTLKKSVNQIEYSKIQKNDNAKSSYSNQGSYLAISAANREKKDQKQQLNLFKTEQKQSKKSIQESYLTSSRQSTQFPNQYPISYQQYKQNNRVQSASIQQSTIGQQKQSSSRATDMLSPQRSQRA